MALLATEEEAEEARRRPVAEALYQGLRGASRQVSPVVPSSRPKLKLKLAGEGPGQVMYMARSSSPKVLPGGLMVAPFQVGWGRVELHVSFLV